MSSIWDVAIAGAGPAGAVAALILARAGRRVLLLDDVRPGAKKIGESLPGAARRLLNDLGLLPVVDRAPHLPCYGNLAAWGSDQLVATDFIRDPYGPGWHLDRARFDADLRTAAMAAGASYRIARIEKATWTGRRWQAALRNGEKVEAMWLIDATGRRARIARQQGAHRCRDDGLVALYTWAVSGPGDTDTRTLIEAVPYGWWYTARLPDGARIVALHVDAKDAIAILHDPRGFESKLAETIHLRPLFEGRQFLTKARGTEAGGARLDRFMGLGWLAAGDAALSFDPLSSQGIFAALYTGMRAGQAVVGALSGNTIGLEAYNARLDSIRTAYLSQHRRQYQMERRWPKHEFWLERGAQSGGLDNAELMLGHQFMKTGRHS